MKKIVIKIAKIIGFLLIIFIVWKIAARDTTSALQVREIFLEDRVVEKTVSSSGEVVAVDDVGLGFKGIGKVYQVAVEKGQEVKEGDLLAQLENYATAQSVQSLKDSRDMVARDIDLFVENYGDNLSAYGGKDEYDIRYRKYQEELSKAEANYQAGLASLWDTYLYAPFAGVVTDVYVEGGEAVLAGTAVVRVSNLQELEFEIELDQEDYGFVKEGQAVEIELDAYDNKTFSGYVSELPFYANGGGANDFEVIIKINESEEQPLMGMIGDAHIVVETTQDPVSSLMFDEIFYDENDDPYVWVLAGNLIEKQYIEIGLEGDVYTEVKSGIDKRILVGLNDNVEMKEGYKAKFPKN
jgi:HlyD family secretion protein